jgi:uncharacterized protein YcbK (DUF882 family)
MISLALLGGGGAVVVLLDAAPKKRPETVGGPVKLTPNFTTEEFKCKDGSTVPASMVPQVQRVAEALEVIRAACGGAAVTVISGYRSPAYNTKIGGAKASQHMNGKAADIQVKGMAPHDVADIVEGLQVAGKIPKGGCGRYATFTHVDVRGYNSRWVG